VNYQIENVYEIRHEMDELIAIHYAQVSTHKHVKRLAPKWERFKELTEGGNCRTATARTDAGELVGYMITFIFPHIHFDCTMAMNDAVFLHPDHRGLTSYRLFEFAIADLRENTEADMFAVHMKIHLPFRSLLAKLGFNQTEESWELEL
jgi:hypothetical protein